MDNLISACIESDDTSQHISVSLNNNHLLLREHFPGNPILPGALTISMIADFSRQFFEEKKIIGFYLAQIERVSFIRCIQPIRNYHFRCSYKLENEYNAIRLMFVVLDSNHLKTEYARGVLIYKKRDMRNESVSCSNRR